MSIAMAEARPSSWLVVPLPVPKAIWRV